MKRREDRRIAEESKVARDYQKITTGDYLLFWEEVVEEENIEEAMREMYRGLSVAELRCPVVLGRALEDCDATDIGHEVKVHRYRQPAGDLNKGFVPGVLAGAGARKWEVDISRDAVLLIAPEFTNARPFRLTAATKKKLCEVQPAAAMFNFGRGTGITRVAVQG